MNNLDLQIMKELQDEISEIFKILYAEKDHIDFHQSFYNLKELFNKNHSDDWRFNSFHWVMDTHQMLMNVIYSYVQMKARVILYRNHRNKGDSQSNSHPQVNFYSQASVVNLYSCRDKLALMVWAYFHPFNPENKKEVLPYRSIVERLKAPNNFGFNFTGQDEFIAALNLLGNASNEFKRLEEFRHYKIHRWEPRIEIFGKQNHHGWPYLVLDYNNNDIKPTMIKSKLNDLIWDYEDVEHMIELCIKKMLNSLTQCYNLFSIRNPYIK